MALSPSLTAASKVAGLGALGGGGIAGTGLLIHKQLQKTTDQKSEEILEEDYQLTGLDKQLADEEQSKFSIESESFTVDSSNKEATLKVKASSDKSDSQFTGDKWMCTIKGKIKESQKSQVTFSNGTGGTFDSPAQKDKFKVKFNDSNSKQQYKKGFIKSCARNSSGSRAEGNLSSEIVVELVEKVNGTNKKYEFSDTAINSIFSGTWNNSTQK